MLEDKDSYPVVLTVREVAKICRIGLNSAYELVQRPDVPAIRHGRRLIIPRDQFFTWLATAGLPKEYSLPS